MKGASLLAVLAVVCPIAAAPAADLAVKSGDVVVFLGDSVMDEYGAQGGDRVSVPTHVESFLTVRYPDLSASYCNLAITGDTAEAVLNRLERDAMPLRPTVAVVCVGFDECLAKGFDVAKLGAHKDALAKIVAKLQGAGVRVFLLSPPSVDENLLAEPRSPKANDVLAQCVAAQKEVAAAAKAAYIDWFARSVANRDAARQKDAGFAYSADGITLNQRALTFAASLALEALGATPIAIEIKMDWQTGKVESNVGNVSGGINQQGHRILRLENIPLPWSTFVGQVVMRGEEWEAAEWCRLVLKVDNPPQPGVFMKMGEREAPMISQQLLKGHNLALYEPIRSYKPSKDLGQLIRRKNVTRVHAWRDQELQPIQQPELVDAQRALIDAWHKYVEGYRKMIAAAPKTFDLNAELRHFALPTPTTRRRPATRPAGDAPAPAAQPAPAPAGEAK